MVAMEDAAQQGTANTRLRVLLVDDDHEDSVLFEHCAERVAGYDVDLRWTNDYSDALRLIRQEDFDIHFIDFRLGHASGLELVSRALEHNPRKQFVLLTGFGDPTVAAECRRRGALDYMPKSSLNPMGLARCFRACMHARPPRLNDADHELFDELPGVYRFEAFLGAARSEIEAERQTAGYHAVLIVDVDRFADLVSEHGPDVGNQTMRAFASAVRGCLRHEDMLGRYGQDKLCILSYVREAWIAAELAEQVRAAVERNTVVTASVGVAHAPARQANIKTLLARADAAQAAAQGKGRNRVEVISMSMRLPAVPGDTGRSE